MAGLAQDFADLERVGLKERVEKDTRLAAVSAFRDAFALKIMFAWARRSSSLNRDLDTPSTLAVFRAVANGALIRVVINCILHLRFVPFHRIVRTPSPPALAVPFPRLFELRLFGPVRAPRALLRRRATLILFRFFFAQYAQKRGKLLDTLSRTQCIASD
jgi:hypothetical protein